MSSVIHYQYLPLWSDDLTKEISSKRDGQFKVLNTELTVQWVNCFGGAESKITRFQDIDLLYLIRTVYERSVAFKERGAKSFLQNPNEKRTINRIRLDYYDACDVLAKMCETLDQKILEKSEQYNFITRLIIKISLTVRKVFVGKEKFYGLLKEAQKNCLHITPLPVNQGAPFPNPFGEGRIQHQRLPSPYAISYEKLFEDCKKEEQERVE